jgi:hypothetical protein
MGTKDIKVAGPEAAPTLNPLLCRAESTAVIVSFSCTTQLGEIDRTLEKRLL